jgi:hypothetical protein
MYTAQDIAIALWKNGENYHAGTIEDPEWRAENLRLWLKAEAAGVAGEVTRLLREAE